MAIYHGSVRRPVALQRSDSPVSRPVPALAPPLVPSPVPSTAASPEAPAPNESVPTIDPVSASIVAAQSPSTSGVKKKRSKPAKSGKSTVAPIDEEAVQSDSASMTSSAPSSASTALAAVPVSSPVSVSESESESVEHLLHLPRGELARLLAEADGSANKVWLALIYRLSALESQVTELAAALRSAASPAAKMPVAAGRDGGDGRSDVLEQVFRKNLSLRKSGGG